MHGPFAIRVDGPELFPPWPQRCLGAIAGRFPGLQASSVLYVVDAALAGQGGGFFCAGPAVLLTFRRLCSISQPLHPRHGIYLIFFVVLLVISRLPLLR